MRPPPIQIQTTSGKTATPSVIRPRTFGDDTRVRYTSVVRPVRTDGVPIAWFEFGKVDTDGAYVPRSRPPRSIRTSADTLVFCGVRVVLLPT